MKQRKSIYVFFTLLLCMPSVAWGDITSKNYVDTELAKKVSVDALDIIVATLTENAVQSTEKGAPNGVAMLDAAGKVPESQLPAKIKVDWNAASGDAQILNRPAVGLTAGTIAAGNDPRFSAIATSEPKDTLPSGYVYLWFE